MFSPLLLLLLGTTHYVVARSTPSFSQASAIVGNSQLKLLGPQVMVMARMDSIVDPGKASGHLHSVVGPSSWGPNATFESLRAAGGCTSLTLGGGFDLSALVRPLPWLFCVPAPSAKDNGVLAIVTGRRACIT